jgi:hypothetical protein
MYCCASTGAAAPCSRLPGDRRWAGDLRRAAPTDCLAFPHRSGAAAPNRARHRHHRHAEARREMAEANGQGEIRREALAARGDEGGSADPHAGKPRLK